MTFIFYTLQLFHFHIQWAYVALLQDRITRFCLQWTLGGAVPGFSQQIKI
jgi:hypothetical protein